MCWGVKMECYLQDQKGEDLVRFLGKIDWAGPVTYEGAKRLTAR